MFKSYNLCFFGYIDVYWWLIMLAYWCYDGYWWLLIVSNRRLTSFSVLPQHLHIMTWSTGYGHMFINFVGKQLTKTDRNWSVSQGKCGEHIYVLATFEGTNGKKIHGFLLGLRRTPLWQLAAWMVTPDEAGTWKSNVTYHIYILYYIYNIYIYICMYVYIYYTLPGKNGGPLQSFFFSEAEKTVRCTSDGPMKPWNERSGPPNAWNPGTHLTTVVHRRSAYTNMWYVYMHL
jgi:hypothetical protein